MIWAIFSLPVIKDSKLGDLLFKKKEREKKHAPKRKPRVFLNNLCGCLETMEKSEYSATQRHEI